jgi:hypothetical protein
MLNNQNLILVAISIISLTSIYLLYTNFQKMQDVTMIKEEIVLLKSSLSKMNSYENEIFIKINERLKNIEESRDLNSNTRSSATKSNVDSIFDNQLTEENINLLNQEFEKSSISQEEQKDHNNEELDNILLNSEELDELNSLDVEELNNTDEMRQTGDLQDEVVDNRVTEVEDIDVEELNVESSDSIEDLVLENEDSEKDGQVSNKSLTLGNEDNVSIKTNLTLDLAQLLKEKGVEDLPSNLEEVVTATEQVDTATEQVDTATEQVDTATEQVDTATEQVDTATEQVDTATEQIDTATETKSPLDSFLIDQADNELDDLEDDLDLDDLDDLEDLNDNTLNNTENLSENYLNGLTVKELKSLSKQKGLKTRGNKKELINIILKGK